MSARQKLKSSRTCSKRKATNHQNNSDETESRYFSKRTTMVSTSATPKKLSQQFYNQSCTALAKALLGKLLVRILDDGQRLSGRIVETESYMGVEDSAAHTYKGHRSERNEAMYMSPGTTYVYLIYGMYSCLNISSKGEGCAVLIRALEPVQGEESMIKHRSKRRKDTSKPLKPKDLCSGPGKLTEALVINKILMDKKDLSAEEETTMWIEDYITVDDGEDSTKEIVECPRIGIDYATPEWVAKPLRFYWKGNICVSKRDKKAEELQFPSTN